MPTPPQPGDRYEQLPETYVIFITENDYFHSGCPLYHVERMIRELARPFEDRAHILYVNGPIGAGTGSVP